MSNHRLSESYFQQSVQVVWSRWASSCQNSGGMGQRDERLVSTVSTRWHFISCQTHNRHFINLFFFFSLWAAVQTELHTVKAICRLFAAYSLFKRTEDEYIPDAESLRQVKEQHMQPQTCSLAQCFQLYTKEEQVGRRLCRFDFSQFLLSTYHIFEKVSQSWHWFSHYLIQTCVNCIW